MKKINLAGKITIIIIISILWSLLIPGIIAYKNKVFYAQDVRNKLSDSAIFKNNINSGSISIAWDSIKNNVQNHRVYSKSESINSRKSEVIYISGFADNILNIVWLSTFVFLLFYILLFHYKLSRKSFSIQTLILGLGIYFLFASSNWVRNSAVGKTGRHIYTFVHLDIDKTSFLLQEFRAITFSILLSIVWCNCLIRYEIIKKRQLTFYKNITPNSFLNYSAKIKMRFLEWQRDSILIFCVFLPWTWFYWQNISAYDDKRFLLQAILFHGFWIISWILASLSIINTGYLWWKYKQKLLLNISQNINDTNKVQFDLIMQINPFPKNQIFVSGLTGIVSILSPLIQIFLK